MINEMAINFVYEYHLKSTKKTTKFWSVKLKVYGILELCIVYSIYVATAQAAGSY